MIGQLRNERGDRGGMTCSKGLQIRIELAAAVARIEPLYMGRTLYELSYPAAPPFTYLNCLFSVKNVCDLISPLPVGSGETVLPCSSIFVIN